MFAQIIKHHTHIIQTSTCFPFFLLLQDYDKETYTNAEVISIDQDVLGRQGLPVFSNCPPHNQAEYERDIAAGNAIVPPCQQVWARPLSNGDVALAFVNYSPLKATVTCDAACMRAIGLPSATFRDVWAHTVVGKFSEYKVTLEGMGHSALYRLSPTSA